VLECRPSASRGPEQHASGSKSKAGECWSAPNMFPTPFLTSAARLTSFIAPASRITLLMMYSVPGLHDSLKFRAYPRFF
jgi:hypothetical protein